MQSPDAELNCRASFSSLVRRQAVPVEESARWWPVAQLFQESKVRWFWGVGVVFFGGGWFVLDIFFSFVFLFLFCFGRGSFFFCFFGLLGVVFVGR